MIRTIDFSDPADVARHDRMVSLVEKMLALHKQLPESLPRLPKRLPWQAARSRPQTGRSTVARLYGLTEEEIEIVEAASK